MGMILKIKQGMKEHYIKAHENVWSEVLGAIKQANIQNNTAFVNDELLSCI